MSGTKARSHACEKEGATTPFFSGRKSKPAGTGVHELGQIDRIKYCELNRTAGWPLRERTFTAHQPEVPGARSAVPVIRIGA